MYYDFIHRYKQYFKIAGIGVFVLFVAWGVLTYVDRNGKIPVVVSVVPNDASVLFDKENKGNGTHYMKAGTYQVVVQKEGFKKDTRTIIVTDKKQQNVVAVSLSAQSDSAKKWVQEHEAEYAKNQIYGAIEAESNGRFFTEKNPITTKLPFNDPYFTIGYITNKDQSVDLTIVTPSPRYRFYAVQKIRDMGYDPTDFKIIFKDFRNPLEKK